MIRREDRVPKSLRMKASVIYSVLIRVKCEPIGLGHLQIVQLDSVDGHNQHI